MDPLAPDTGISVILKGYAWWFMIPLGALLAFLIVRLYRRETAPYDRAGAWLRALRAAVVVLLVLLLSQPVFHRVTAKYEPPVVVVLRDQSSSMSTKDIHEPPERKVRTAAAIGLLDAALRDLNAERAAAALETAQTSTENAAAAVRQALQQMQESGAAVAGIQDRLTEARRALGRIAADARRAAAGLSAVAQAAPQQKDAANRCVESAASLEREVGEVPAKSADARRFLQDKGQALKVLRQELGKLRTAARQLQDRADRALGESGRPEVKAAIEKLDRMDRAALVAAVLEKSGTTPKAPPKPSKEAGASIPEETASGARIVTYNIDTDLRSVDSAPAAEKEKDKAPNDNARADTDLATPLLKLAERHAQDTITAVVLCSDGRHTTGPLPEDAARAIAARGIALHTLGVGSLDPPRDICVARLDGTLSVFLDETIRLTAHVKIAGLKGRQCKLVLRQNGKEIQQRDLALASDGWLAQNFEITANKSGPNVFTATIDPLPDETLLTNNSAEAVVDVANDRLKVLVVDELPRWETRYVASLLRRERKMSLTDRWLLSGENVGPRRKALPDDRPAGGKDGGAQPGVLDEYDIVVLGDVTPERLDAADQKRLAKYVADRGGFLIVIAGSKAVPLSYPSGPLADLLPIKQQLSAAAPVLASTDAAPHVRVKLDPDGSRSEIMRVLRDPVLNEQLWPALPELQWVARPAFAKPGAVTLLSTDDVRKDVVAAIHNYGAGRVLYLGTDNTWRWRYKVGDRIHAVFWSQAFRWGTSNRLSGSERLKVGVDRRQIRPGENLEVIARPRDKQGRLAPNAMVVAELEDKSRPQRVQLQPVPDSGGLYRGVLQNLGAGIHTVVVKVESPDGDGVSENVQVIAREVAGQEGVELSRDATRLAAMAGAGGGQYADILEAPQLFKGLSGQGKQRALESSCELWASYPALILVVLLLAAEWLLRKRIGLA